MVLDLMNLRLWIQIAILYYLIQYQHIQDTFLKIRLQTKTVR